MVVIMLKSSFKKLDFTIIKLDKIIQTKDHCKKVELKIDQ